MNSRMKGKRGELEVAEILRGEGFQARRGVQYHGGPDSPDVVGIPGVHLEVKRTEKSDIYGWMAQAEADAGENIPAVIHRRNNREWVVILPLNRWIEMVKGWLSWKTFRESTK